MMQCPETRHWCSQHRPLDPFCGSPHPDNKPGGDDDDNVYCRRLRGHGGDHSVVVKGLSPDSWPGIDAEAGDDAGH